VARERLLVLQELFPAPVNAANGLTLNGQSVPNIAIRRGEEQRWRILNASASRFFNLHVVGHRFRRIALDGNYIPNFGELPEVDVLPLGPAERAEVLITGNVAGEEPTYEVRALLKRPDPALPPGFRIFPPTTPVFDQDFAALDDAGVVLDQDYNLLARLVIEKGEGAQAELPPTVIPLPRGPIKESADRVIAFAPPASLAIDGQHFNHGRVDQTVELGATETWRLVNEHDPNFGWHPFHLHVNDFDILRTSPSGDALDRPYYLDTVPLPPVTLVDAAGDPNAPDNRLGGWVEISSNFYDFTGRFVYHCHFLDHEDFGMMGVVEVVKHVELTGAGFPETISIDAGSTVQGEPNSGTTLVWTNLDTTLHTVTADVIDSLTGRPSFDSGDLERGRSFAHTFDAPGIVTYHCAKHPDEQGSIIVAATQTIEIHDAAFEPNTLTITPGTSVVWTNRDSTSHTITLADHDAAGPEPIAASAPLQLRDTFAYTFTTIGNFAYRSSTHPEQTGTITVAAPTRRSASIRIHDDWFDPSPLPIPTGGTVTWTNRGGGPQTITQEGWPAVATAFDSGHLSAEELYTDGPLRNPGQRFSHRFDGPPGPVTYFSRLVMAGTITVTADAPVTTVPVSIVNAAFVPQEIVIGLGSTVTWTNTSTAQQTVSTDTRGDTPGSVLFDQVLNPGESFSQTFSQPSLATRGVPVAFFSKMALRGQIDVI
jgi:plastocyanin